MKEEQWYCTGMASHRCSAVYLPTQVLTTISRDETRDTSGCHCACLRLQRSGWRRQVSLSALGSGCAQVLHCTVVTTNHHICDRRRLAAPQTVGVEPIDKQDLPATHSNTKRVSARTYTDTQHADCCDCRSWWAQRTTLRTHYDRYSRRRHALAHGGSLTCILLIFSPPPNPRTTGPPTRLAGQKATGRHLAPNQPNHWHSLADHSPAFSHGSLHFGRHTRATRLQDWHDDGPTLLSQDAINSRRDVRDVRGARPSLRGAATARH
ncbi:hypothetical protein C0Q70_11933 [Pomacea canaliculata]|uniref:Uncharacterized protein n=1 Tax=Pomacea canaliculata TaxID=400727 RepID=A0A2T7P7C4_POMCA|nr:hypothetical protein C0Q70_11933 [Pomacea canaliculata]